MPTTPATGDTTARAVDEQFLDLIYGDRDLLAAEFDAIIAAQWPDPPASIPGHAAGGHLGSRGAARRGAEPVRNAAVPPRHPGLGGWARQRSPPFPASEPRPAGRQVIAPS